MELKQELTEYYKKNKSLFLGSDEILAFTKKKGWFSGHIFITLKERVRSYIKNNEVLFGSEDGFFTNQIDSLLLALNLSTGKHLRMFQGLIMGW